MKDSKELGQFIPLHYHGQMLSDHARMSNFRTAINHVVKPDSVVLELGSGTGVQSFFAAQNARKVYSVEFNPELISESRRFLSRNHNGNRVEIIHADAFEYLPPEPVDVVICEMLHVGLLREKQLEVIDAFKKRYQQRFKDSPLPKFIPEAVIQAIQPVQYDFSFEGYHAPVVMFQDPYSIQSRTTELGNPVVYHQLLYESPFATLIKWSGEAAVTVCGNLNAFRFITKNILALVPESRSAIEWNNQYLILPLEQDFSVKTGQKLEISLEYSAGEPLSALKPKVNVCA